MFDIIEVKPIECSATVNEFNTTVGIDINSADSEELLDEDDMALLEAEFTSSYNTLTQRFCDPFFRSVTNATVDEQSRERRRTQSVFFNNTDESFNTTFFVITLLINVTGSCRGCTSDSTLFDDGFRRLQDQHALSVESFDEFSSQFQRGRNRWLQGADCFCSAVEVVDGGPTEREFFLSYDEKVRQLSTEGRFREVDSLSKLDESERPQDPGAPRPPRATQCTESFDCQRSQQGQLCVSNQCLFQGNPRFTLTWTGDDDYDLSVLTPDDIEISFSSPFDPLSLGVFNTRFAQQVEADHVESIYFPPSGTAPSGLYEVAVTQFAQRGGASDTWLLEIFGSQGVLEQSHSGQGGTASSGNLAYFFGDDAPPNDCAIAGTIRCCEDRDCTSNNLGDFCVGSQCVARGNPRFTLHWFGGKQFSTNRSLSHPLTLCLRRSAGAYGFVAIWGSHIGGYCRRRDIGDV